MKENAPKLVYWSASFILPSPGIDVKRSGVQERRHQRGPTRPTPRALPRRQTRAAICRPTPPPPPASGCCRGEAEEAQGWRRREDRWLRLPSSTRWPWSSAASMEGGGAPTRARSAGLSHRGGTTSSSTSGADGHPHTSRRGDTLAMELYRRAASPRFWPAPRAPPLEHDRAATSSAARAGQGHPSLHAHLLRPPCAAATSSSASYCAARCSPACSIRARSSRPEGEGEGEMRARTGRGRGAARRRRHGWAGGPAEEGIKGELGEESRGDRGARCGRACRGRARSAFGGGGLAGRASHSSASIRRRGGRSETDGGAGGVGEGEGRGRCGG
jgi:hypothetical protein